MGEGMAARLISENVAGIPESPLVVWNRSTSKCQDLKDRFPGKSIEVKGTAKEVVEDCDITL
jgi:3-hydroxyisobutyrate dehydrogenase/glyoxylate/succinic semialdehyde reductase